MEVIKYIQDNWINWLFAITTGILGFGYKSLSFRIKQHRKEQDAIREGVLALLHDRLYQGCRYYIQHGKISDDEMKNMEYLYNGYHALGGNGTGTELYNRIKKLPLKEGEL